MNNKKSWKEILFAEPLEPRSIDEIQQALKRGENIDIDYDAAARKAARLYIEAAQKNKKIGRILGRLAHISISLNRYLKKGNRDMIWQDWFLDLLEYLDYVLKKENPEIDEEIDKLGLTGFQHGWAVQAAIGFLKEENYFDEYYFPRTREEIWA